MCVRVRECQEAGARLVVDGAGRLLHGAGWFTVQDIIPQTRCRILTVQD